MPATIERAERPRIIVPKKQTHLRYFSWGLVLFTAAWAVLYFSLCSDPWNNLRMYFPLVGVGFGAAILANISAVGGGIIFIPTMLLCFHLPAVLCLKVAIATQSLGLTSGAIAWYRAGAVSKKLLVPAIPGLFIGSTISSLVIHPSALLIKTNFAPVSILVGLVTLLMLNRKSESNLISPVNNTALFVISVVGGLITGWISIGEGELIAAYLMLSCGLAAAESIGIGVVLLAVNSIYLTLIHSFFAGGIPWHIVAFTALGAVFGARLAPFLCQWISARTLKIIFSTIAIVDGIVFLVQVGFTNVK
jgi:uncharacterized protein